MHREYVEEFNAMLMGVQQIIAEGQYAANHCVEREPHEIPLVIVAHTVTHEIAVMIPFQNARTAGLAVPGSWRYGPLAKVAKVPQSLLPLHRFQHFRRQGVHSIRGIRAGPQIAQDVVGKPSAYHKMHRLSKDPQELWHYIEHVEKVKEKYHRDIQGYCYGIYQRLDTSSNALWDADGVPLVR